jgi:hypothetical protein
MVQWTTNVPDQLKVIVWESVNQLSFDLIEDIRQEQTRDGACRHSFHVTGQTNQSISG